MRMHLIAICSIVLAGSACTAGTSPTAPIIIDSVSVQAVATAQPAVWDSRDELAAWVQNAATTGAVTLAGDGDAAVIQVNVSSGDAMLHGPELGPNDRQVSSAKIRYRWMNRGSNDVLLMTMYLRPPVYDSLLHLPRLFAGLPHDLSQPPEENSGDWVEQDFTDHNVNASRPPYAVLFPTIVMTGSGSVGPASIHGIVEIDRITLIRP